MNHLFVSYEIANKLKELGFNEPCFGAYYNKYGDVTKTNPNEKGDAPLYQQVLDWFREKHNIIIQISFDTIHKSGEYYFSIIKIDKNNYPHIMNTEFIDSNFKDYYETLDTAILEAIKLKS